MSWNRTDRRYFRNTDVSLKPEQVNNFISKEKIHAHAAWEEYAYSA
jgi:hypothetical protein